MEIDLKDESAAFVAELHAALTALQTEIRERELRLEAKLDGLKADIMRRVFLLLLGALTLNILVIFGVIAGLVGLAGSD